MGFIFFFETIQNSTKPNRVIQVWKEVYHEIFGGWEGQTMWNLHKNMWCIQKHILVKKCLQMS